MSELLPSVQAGEITKGLVDFLTTTFALSEPEAQTTLQQFLQDPEDGIFRGPYVRLRLPFRAADPGWETALEWTPPIAPYGHQAEAIARLSSLQTPEHDGPQPTLVTTGTGSGKTEAFLYPILDHVLRAKRQGIEGIKALILYPMNALANDQARRITDLIMTDSALGGIRAALYVGEEGPQRSAVTKDGLITSRPAMREQAPDILLTNYKMLDQLLLRPSDATLWDQSATSLQYLVLDEFHTYDGAQGTDVAMLLRRLGLALKGRWADDDFDAAARQRPLGVVTPVATSATLGDGSDPTAMIAFANTVFGGGFNASSVVTETRLSVDEWAREAIEAVEKLHLAPVPLIDARAAQLQEQLSGHRRSPEEITAAVLELLYVAVEDEDGQERYAGALASATDAAGRLELEFTLVLAHPFVRSLVIATEQATSLAELARSLFPGELVSGERPADRDDARRTTIVMVLAALSHLRKEVGRRSVSVDLHLWVRSLTRVDRAAQALPEFRWADDGELRTDTGIGPGAADVAPAFPALYCRHCGRSGWGVELAPTGWDLAQTDANIRRNHATKLSKSRFRALIHAPREGELALDGESDDDGLTTGPWWFRVADRQITSERPDADDEGVAVPVLTLTGNDADDESRDDVCPNCGKTNGIRFLGSAIATQLSTVVTTLFGDRHLDVGEKKALVFTDSVQDAAHRAGFIQSRARVFNLRNAVRQAVVEETTLDDIPAAMIAAAHTPSERYRLLPPDLAERNGFRGFWDTDKAVSAVVKKRVQRRLAFDLALEFGLESRVGRTLEETGSLAAHVEAGPASRLEAVGRAAVEGLEVAGSLDDTRDGLLDAASVVRWVRGTLERLRERGAIDHPWLVRYVENDGNRHWVWGGRPRHEGMPAFPQGREAPAFARVGKKTTGARESALDTVASSQSWYARWTARCLGVVPSAGEKLARRLFETLDREGIVTSRPIAGGDTRAYGLAPSSIIIAPVVSDGTGQTLVCDTCETETPSARTTVEQLAGGPCTMARCPGTLLLKDAAPENFYRDQYDNGKMRRVVAREHTSLLEDKLRLDYETQFKNSDAQPDAPNVLVATPTLEMGIDIGDLSTVFLAGLPRTVSSYLQRVGRAGRLTGNALILAFVLGRGDQLPKIGDPSSVINGAVRPPATYLNAVEILRRQYTAFVIDQLAAAGEIPEIQYAPKVLGDSAAGSFLDLVIRHAEEHADEHLARFTGAFGSLNEDVIGGLADWARPVGTAERSSQLARTLLDASLHWNQELEQIRIRIKTIEESLPELKRLADQTQESDDVSAARAAAASLRLARKQSGQRRTEFWVAALERYGVLPNYTLLDDRVQLDVGLTWIDPESGEFAEEQRSYERGRSRAISEFAPGAHFYAQGLDVTIDAVDLGTDGERVRTMAFCPECGFARDLDQGPIPTCPRCSSTAIADVDQRLRVVEIEHVSAEIRRDESSISDANEERERVRFTVQLAADLDDADVSAQWYVEEVGFGCKFARSMTLRWVNLGRAGLGASRFVAGSEHAAPLFRVCKGCGKLDREGDTNNAWEHRAWCRFRKDRAEHTDTIALTRTLTTQAIVLRVPPSMTVGDALSMPSLSAAIQLGLREVIGGDPDHLQLATIVEPVPGEDVNNLALLIHDTVPGGTGYLADLADPPRIREVFEEALAALERCDCATDPVRAACDKCLLPFAPGGDVGSVSRTSALHNLHVLLQYQNGSASEWSTTEVDPGVQDPESHLEQWFRKVFKERVTALGASLKEIPGEWGSTIQVTLPGQHRTWSLRPQQLVGGTRPDFVLEASGAPVPPVAIYADGFAYHASPAHLRLADDVTKRQGLRDLGYRVIALTWDDLRRLRDDEAEPDLDVHDPSMSMKFAGPFQLTPADVTMLRENPVTTLMGWIQGPEDAAARTERLADALPMLAIRRGRMVAESGSIVEQAIALALDSTGPLTVGPTSWALRSTHLAMLARRPAGVTGATPPETVLVLDDGPEALTAPGFREAWQRWLRLSNLLGARLAKPVTITTASATASVAVAPTAPIRDESRADLTTEWQELIALAEPEEAAVLQPLAEVGIAVPALGHETASGIPIPVAWPGERIALDVLLSSADRDDLLGEGWSLVSPSDDPALLRIPHHRKDS
ncbi:DEAD/DEAH box helicase [Curtobacterium flaccumfaciens]|uniref:DEAD/DEAH box helicase n=1 Tax=Curtobacterium poinsettiae TaxID=159612 RepID=A0A9Q9P5Q4_9MICO|nr:DEAD/DEAH box helicase [Curtobacterium flaccumfaciens]UXN24516.1 DEAD/DEAH box helicase [Curtobacterium flaccumfaciens]UYC79352.1 DEAD/DEAH box helicase [Curtobacterium flaccumfaciens pv. poinsettiae]